MGRVIVWRVTQNCNMKCRFCSYSTEVERVRGSADDTEAERLCGVFGDYKRQTGTDMLVSWIGGEPFLWKNIIPFSEMLHGYGINVSTTTNGLLLDRIELQRSVVDCFSEVVFSLDGFEDCNDIVRQQYGHFEEVSRNIRTLAKLRDECGSDMKIKVNTILMRRNIDRFEEFCSYLQWLGVDEVTFNQLGGFDRPEFFEENRLTRGQVETFAERFPKVKKLFGESGLIIHGSEKYLDRILKTSRKETNPIAECDPGAWFWFINESGFISPCSYTSYEYKLDTREIRSAEDFARAETYFRQCRAERRSKWCDDCYCTQVYDKFE
ncbi:MAG: radical SAM protein [Oscillospiraceae bacterium]|nr:radical SAM protein [Oscillospiraceae bacterium]